MKKSRASSTVTRGCELYATRGSKSASGLSDSQSPPFTIEINGGDGFHGSSLRDRESRN